MAVVSEIPVATAAVAAAAAKTVLNDAAAVANWDAAAATSNWDDNAENGQHL
jgi:hypothetical protein